MIKSMAEMSKEMKIVIIVNVIVAFIYGFFQLIFPEIYYQLTDAPAIDVLSLRVCGGALVVLGIFGIIAIIRADWEKVKIAFEIAITYEIILLIIDIVGYITVTGSATWITGQIIATIIKIILIVINIYFYLQEEKRT